MTFDQIIIALTTLFDERGHRITFWNDPDKEFTGFVSELKLNAISIVNLDDESALEIKKRVEIDDPMGRYLLYSTKEAPPMEEDWLLDIRLYSHTFRADRSSILLNDLGLLNHSLRSHISIRKKFFENKERLAKLRSLVGPTDIEADIDRKMIAVLLKADQASLFCFLRELYQDMAVEEQLDLAIPTSLWEQLGKFDMEAFFWGMVRAEFGYEEETASLKNLLIRLLVTDFGMNYRSELPNSLRNLLLPESGRANAAVFLSQWRDSSSTGQSYDILSSKVAEMLQIPGHLAAAKLDVLEEVMTFVEVEKRIASLLRDRVQERADSIKVTEVRLLANKRLDGHWASQNLPTTYLTPRLAFRAVYQALIVAAEFFEKKRSYAEQFHYPSAGAFWKAYADDLYQFDQFYRLFCEQADYAEAEGWSILKPLREEIENHYGTWFITRLAVSWGERIQGGLLQNWKLSGTSNQQNFYKDHVAPLLAESESRRIFVIISDAFRYEAAQELLSELNGKYRFKATLETMLGVLPSYTALGMGSLLPHRQLGYKASGEVLVDQKSSSGLDARNKILESYAGIAVKAEELIAMRKDEGRDFVRGKKLVYVYHNQVDSTGDSASTESETFKAVRSTINSLGQLIRHIINSLNGSQVYVTADHGFLFQESYPSDIDKSELPEKPEGTAIAKKRYLLGAALPEHHGVWHGETSTTAGAEGGMEFWIPKGVNRFHFTGGARFIHGGAMLQEIMIPVISVREVEGKSAVETKTKLVQMIVSGQKHKITTSRHRFQFIQAEPVNERVKAATLKVGIYDDKDVPVTELLKETFASKSDNMSERSRFVTLLLLDKKFDSKKIYYLKLTDAETGIEQLSVEVTIDKAFHDDF